MIRLPGNGATTPGTKACPELAPPSGRLFSSSFHSGRPTVTETRQYSEGIASGWFTTNESWLFFRREIVFRRPLRVPQIPGLHEVLHQTLKPLHSVFCGRGRDCKRSISRLAFLASFSWDLM